MALSADAVRKARGNRQHTDLPIATSATVYIGGLITRRKTTGRAIAAVNSSTNQRIAGVAVEFVGPDASGVGNAAGTEKVRVAYLDEHEFTVQTAIRTNTSLGLNVFVVDDDVVGGTQAGTTGQADVLVGELVAWVDETGTSKAKGYVALRRFADTNIAV